MLSSNLHQELFTLEFKKTTDIVLFCSPFFISLAKLSGFSAKLPAFINQIQKPGFETIYRTALKNLGKINPYFSLNESKLFLPKFCTLATGDSSELHHFFPLAECSHQSFQTARQNSTHFQLHFLSTQTQSGSVNDEDDTKFDEILTFKRRITVAMNRLVLSFFFSIRLCFVALIVSYRRRSDLYKLPVVTSLWKIRCLEILTMIASSAISLSSFGAWSLEKYTDEKIRSLRCLARSEQLQDTSTAHSTFNTGIAFRQRAGSI